jgi:hypothetical protein
MCKRHAGYANLPLYITVKAFASCRWKLLRGCLTTVIKVQRDMKMCKKEMKEWAEKEIALDRSYHNMAM